MPERQPAPGEAADRPEPDVTERGDGDPAAADGAVESSAPDTAPDGAQTGASAEPSGPDSAPVPDAAAGNGAAPVPTAAADEARTEPEPEAPRLAPLPQRVPSRVPAPEDWTRARSTPGGAALFEPSRSEPAAASEPADESPTVRTSPPAESRTDAGPPAERPADRPAERPADRAPAAASAGERTAVVPPASRPTADRPAQGTGNRAPADESPTVAVRAAGAPRPLGSRPEPVGEQATTAMRRPPEPAPAGPPAGVDAPTERLQRPSAPSAAPAPARDEEPTAVAPAASRPTVFAPVPVGGHNGDPAGGFGGGYGGGFGDHGGDHGGPDDPDGPRGGPDGGRPRRKRRFIYPLAALGVLAALYAGDLALSSGSVPRGVNVAGLSIGGLGVAEAEQRLHAEIDPRTTQPVAVTLGDASSEIDPAKAGLAVDWPATLDQIGSQPLNPITRITSFFTERKLDVVSAVDDAALTSAVEELSPIMDKEPVEGGVRFEGTTPVAVQPVPGQRLDVPAAVAQLRTDWVLPGPLALPLVEQQPVTTPADVERAITEVAEPAVSAPVTVVGEAGTEGTLEPEVIASALSFRGEPGQLVPELNQELLVEELTPQLAASETPGKDASLDFSTGQPVVSPSKDGRGVDYPATLKDLLTVLTVEGEREVTAVYADKPAELTTDELSGLGISGVIGEFQTGGFAQDSGRNIKRAAEVINGMVVQPGETFSLNEATSPRDASNGYVEAGIIDNGRAGRGIGGGVSQVATTLYNAAYFAGMVDVQHKEHSFYISRYPAGREATVFEGSIDMKFRNDNPTGVLIQTEWTPTTLTVRLYGTKRYEVTSSPGPRTNPTTPNTVNIPAGERCVPSNGAPGFTITDTRTLKEIATGEVRTETRTVKYNPVPIVICGG